MKTTAISHFVFIYLFSLLTLVSFKACTIFFLLLNTEKDILKNAVVHNESIVWPGSKKVVQTAIELYYKSYDRFSCKEHTENTFFIQKLGIFWLFLSPLLMICFHFMEKSFCVPQSVIQCEYDFR